jgi:hypothetical protein
MRTKVGGILYLREGLLILAADGVPYSPFRVPRGLAEYGKNVHDVRARRG